MNETNKLQGRLYNESEWKRCWISSYRDGGWVIGEIEYSNGLHYIINSDFNGELLVPERYVNWST